jgi:anthranilate phosphoribosyltransferase
MIKITEYLDIILEGKDLSFEQAKKLLDTIFTGEAPEMQIAAFLAAMRVKKAAVSELEINCIGMDTRPRMCRGNGIAKKKSTTGKPRTRT